MTVFSGVGQSCVAPSRLLVQDTIYDDFMAQLVEWPQLVEKVSRIRVGDPFDPATQLGPVGTLPQFEKNAAFCERGVADGASVGFGGGPMDIAGHEGGYFFSPTVFQDVDPTSYIAQEEAFGPILSAIRFSTEDEAIEIANSTKYALAAGVWTRDLRRAHVSAKRLRAGMVWVNTYRNISFASPFGGSKESGHGRENGPEALAEFTAPKSVWIELSGQVADPFTWKS